MHSQPQLPLSHNYVLIFGFVSTLNTDQSYVLRIKYYAMCFFWLGPSPRLSIPCYLNVIPHLTSSMWLSQSSSRTKFQKDLLIGALSSYTAMLFAKSLQLHRTFYINSMESLTCLCHRLFLILSEV